MKKEMQDLKHPYVGTEHLLLSILHNEEFNITKELLKYGLSYDKYRSEIINVIGVGKKTSDIFLYTPLLKRVIENCILNAKDLDSLIDVDDLFVSILEEGEGIANRILLGMNIDIDFLYDKFINGVSIRKKGNNKKLLISEYSINLNDKFKEVGFDPVIGRDLQVNRLIEILLRRTKNNPVLVGDAGVGKTAIVEELVRRIELGNVPRKLLNTKVYSLSLASLIAGTKYRGEFEERINQIISEIEDDKNVIIFIDEIHTLVGAGGAEGAIDASNILKPYLARGVIRVIGATTKDEYIKYIENDKALDRRFQKINVLEMTASETMNILFNIKNLYENYHGVVISDDIIKSVVLLSERYIHNGKFPDKAIDVFDEVCAKTAIIDDDFDKKIKNVSLEIDIIKSKKNKLILEHKFREAESVRNKQLMLESELNSIYYDIDNKNTLKEVTMDSLYQVIYDRTKIPINTIIGFNKDYVYDKLSKIIYGQNIAIKKIIESIEKFNKCEKNTPLSFLLVGKSGVGKTFFVKEYVKLLFQKENFIKLDMSEFSDDMSVSKIIGAPAGYVGFRETKSLVDKIKDNPYSVILLDNIDKACPKILKLFCQMFEEGILNNSLGEEVNFSHTTIFMTSNYGCMQKKIGFSEADSLMFNNIKVLLGEDFYNRISNVVLFNDLSEHDVAKIIKSRLSNRSLSAKDLDKIIKDLDFKNYGVRKLDSVLDSYVLDMIEV